MYFRDRSNSEKETEMSIYCESVVIRTEGNYHIDLFLKVNYDVCYFT